MNFQDIAEALNGTVYNRGSNYSSAEIEHIVAGDMMSDVLVVDREKVLLLTSLATDQVVHTADIVEASGILLVNDKKPFPGMRRLAEDFDITLISTPLTMFESCVELHKLLKDTETAE